VAGRNTKKMKGKYPKSREGLLKMIVDCFGAVDAVCIVFCDELDHQGEDEKLMDYFCDHRCEVHAKWTGCLFCLPKTAKKMLITNSNIKNK